MVEPDPRWLTDTYFTAEYNRLPEGRARFDLPGKVHIHEVTLREAVADPVVPEGPGNPFVYQTALGWDNEEPLGRVVAATRRTARAETGETA